VSDTIANPSASFSSDSTGQGGRRRTDTARLERIALASQFESEQDETDLAPEIFGSRSENSREKIGTRERLGAASGEALVDAAFELGEAIADANELGTSREMDLRIQREAESTLVGAVATAIKDLLGFERPSERIEREIRTDRLEERLALQQLDRDFDAFGSSVELQELNEDSETETSQQNDDSSEKKSKGGPCPTPEKLDSRGRR
jgi:hypothetical protein